MQAETKQQEVPAPITFAVRNKCVQRVRVVLVSNLSRLDPTEREWLPLVWPDLESRGVGTDPSPPDPVGLDKWLYESGTRPEDYAASDRFMDTYVQAALARAIDELAESRAASQGRFDPPCFRRVLGTASR